MYTLHHDVKNEVFLHRVYRRNPSKISRHFWQQYQKLRALQLQASRCLVVRHDVPSTLTILMNVDSKNTTTQSDYFTVRRRKSRRYRSVCVRTYFSWLRFGTDYKSDIQEIQYFCFSRTIGIMQFSSDQNDKDSLQKTHDEAERRAEKFDDLIISDHNIVNERRIPKESSIRS